MQIFRNRPLALAACLSAVLAALISEWDSRSKLLLGGLILLGLTVAVVVRIRKGFSYRCLVCTLCLSALFLSLLSSFLFFNVSYQKYQALNGKECRAEGYVLERIDSTAFSTLLRVKLTELNGEAVSDRAVIECEYATALQVGDGFRLSGTAREFVTDQSIDEKTFYLSEGCMTVIVCQSAEDCEALGTHRGEVSVMASRLQTALGYRLQSAVGEDGAGLSAALLLGDRSYLSADNILSFRRAGVSHLLALSGLHVSILIAFAEFLLRLFCVPKRARAFAVPLFALGYVAVTGFALSTWRAVLMLSVLYLGFLLRRSYDSFTALCTVLAAILIVTPYAVLDLSLWLSFLAAGAIVIFNPALQRLFERIAEKKPNKLLFMLFKAVFGALFIGVVTNLALLLISAVCFGEISLLSIPVTMLLSLPVTLLIWCDAIALCFPGLFPVTRLCALLERLILGVCRRASRMRHIMLPTVSNLTLLLIAALTLALILFAVCRIKRRRNLLILPILCASVLISSLANTHLPRNADWKSTVITSKLGEVRLYTRHGTAVVINDTTRAVSLSYEIKQTTVACSCGGIEDLVFPRYYNQGTYFISDLSSRILVRKLHLPIPSDAREEAIAKRLTEEAELHGIEVFFDAEEYLLQYDSGA
ncbi:MAG: ComEC/Rec2 family competence protein [Clostridia bacterium]|nr:ComEC/Rec2 family competence protein [Clostridia bacterium]